MNHKPREWFAGDPEPGPEVTGVRDPDMDLWCRVPGGWVCKRPDAPPTTWWAMLNCVREVWDCSSEIAAAAYLDATLTELPAPRWATAQAYLAGEGQDQTPVYRPQYATIQELEETERAALAPFRELIRANLMRANFIEAYDLPPGITYEAPLRYWTNETTRSAETPPWEPDTQSPDLEPAAEFVEACRRQIVAGFGIPSEVIGTSLCAPEGNPEAPRSHWQDTQTPLDNEPHDDALRLAARQTLITDLDPDQFQAVRAARDRGLIVETPPGSRNRRVHLTELGRIRLRSLLALDRSRRHSRTPDPTGHQETRHE